MCSNYSKNIFTRTIATPFYNMHLPAQTIANTFLIEELQPLFTANIYLLKLQQRRFHQKNCNAILQSVLTCSNYSKQLFTRGTSTPFYNRHFTAHSMAKTFSVEEMQPVTTASIYLLKLQEKRLHQKICNPFLQPSFTCSNYSKVVFTRRISTPFYSQHFSTQSIAKKFSLEELQPLFTASIYLFKLQQKGFHQTNYKPFLQPAFTCSNYSKGFKLALLSRQRLFLNIKHMQNDSKHEFRIFFV